MTFMINSDTQIVFIHQGYSWYLLYALYQAISINPQSKVILLADKSRFSQINTYLLSSLESEDITDVKNSYLYLSPNRAKFELFCWLRWFYLRNYMRQNKVNSVLYLDSDVLMFSSLKEIQETYQDLTGNCGLSIPEQSNDDFNWSISGHGSYWTLESLEQFCEFTLTSFKEEKYLSQYQKKWKWHQTENKQGGICDMTTLYLFWQTYPDKIINFAKSHHHTVFDHNINTGSNYHKNQYLTEQGIKKIKWINHDPFFIPTDQQDTLDRAHIIHFQRSDKQYIRQCYTGQNFPEKLYTDMRFYLSRIRRQLSNIYHSFR